MLLRSGGFRRGGASRLALPSPLGDGLTPSLTVLLICDNDRYCIIATPSPVYLFKHVKHCTQNIQNDCHQWLSDSFRLHKIRFPSRWDPAGKAYTAPPDSVAGLRGLILKGREGREGEGKTEKGRGKGGTGPLTQIPGSTIVSPYNCRFISIIFSPSVANFYFSCLAVQFPPASCAAEAVDHEKRRSSIARENSEW